MIKPQIDGSYKDLFAMLVSSVRYALGRESYIVEWTTRFKFWKVGCWAEGISVDFLAHEMRTSEYQIRKAYKQLAEEGYLKLEKVPSALEEYDNGLYTESTPYLFCKAYTLTQKAIDKFEKNGMEL